MCHARGLGRVVALSHLGPACTRSSTHIASQVETSAPVTTVVLKQQEGIGGEIIKAPLGPAAIWPMQLAFYAAEGAGQQGEEFPDFEMTMNIQPNGVVTSLVLNFGEFKVNGVLEKIEELPSSGC